MSHLSHHKLRPPPFPWVINIAREIVFRKVTSERSRVISRILKREMFAVIYIYLRTPRDQPFWQSHPRDPLYY